MDSNFENLCKPELKTNSCYFLLKNDYNELFYKPRVNELYDNAENYNFSILPKKDQDYYSINLNNIKFNSSKKLNIKNIDNDSYIIIKIYNRNLNYKSLTILSAFDGVKPSFQIYSYKLFYLEKPINIKLDDNKAHKYKLKIIKNQDNKGEIRFKKKNDTKDNIIINNNFGKQISFPINKEFDSLEFSSCGNNIITLFVKFDYKKVRKNIEEISFGATPKFISKYDEFPVIFYIKNINDKGLDFNIFLEGKISNLNILFSF